MKFKKLVEGENTPELDNIDIKEGLDDIYRSLDNFRGAVRDLQYELEQVGQLPEDLEDLNSDLATLYDLLNDGDTDILRYFGYCNKDYDRYLRAKEDEENGDN